MENPSNTTDTPADRAVAEHAKSACHWCDMAAWDVEAPACRTMVRLVRAAAKVREAAREAGRR
jgi:hypothetical protein